MLHLTENIKVSAFEDFKNVVKCTLGLQTFKASDYYVRQAAGDNLFTVRFNPKENLNESQLKQCWLLIYKNCLQHGLGNPTYVKDFIPDPCIYNGTLIFTIEFI